MSEILKEDITLKKMRNKIQGGNIKVYVCVPMSRDVSLMIQHKSTRPGTFWVMSVDKVYELS